MIDIKELGSEIWGAFVGLTTMVILTISGEPGVFDLEYWLTKFTDMFCSGLVAIVSFLLVHAAKKGVESKKQTRIKKLAKWFSRLMKK